MMMTWNFQDVFQTVHNVLHVDSFFRWTVEPAPLIKGDLNNPERHIIKLDVSALSLINNSIYFEHDKKITLNMLETLVKEVLTSIWPNTIDLVKSNFQIATVINQAVNDIMEVESRIAQFTPLLDTKYNVETYEYVTIAELNTLAPFIDWNKFFRSAFSQVNITITPSHTVLVTSTTFLRGVSILLTELLADYTGQEKLKNYLCWCTANRYLQILKKSYWKKTGREANIGNYCIAETTNTMPLVVTAMRVQKSFTNELSKIFVENMTKSVKEAFKENVINLDWLDQETREVLDDKVEAMSSLIGDSELILKSTKLSKFSNLKIDSANFYLNNVHLESYSFYENMMKLEHPVDKKWSGPTFRVIRSYPRYENLLFLSSANLVLHKPNFEVTIPHALHFGSIGASVGRALGYINFDSSDRLLQPAFRSKNLRQLSRIASMQGFEKRSSCLIHQYSNYTSNSLNGHPADEKLTLDENIADNGGLKAAYNAFKKWMTTHEEVVLPLPGVNMTHMQLFFLSFAQSWCENVPYRDKQIGGVTRSSEHSSPRYRVVGTLFNMREFSEAFQCPLGSLMNPKAKCEIW